MARTLSPESLQGIAAQLASAHQAFQRRYPGATGDRQPIHTVYGGAHLFRADTARRLGQTALRSLEEFAPDFSVFAKAISLSGWDRLPDTQEAAANLGRIIEAYREAGRDEEQDGHATSVAGEVAAGLRSGELPPFLGIRIKPFSEELRERSVRTLDIFLTELLSKTGGKLPGRFFITLPKVALPEEV